MFEELRNKEMLDYLRKGLSLAYAIPENEINEGSVKTLIPTFHNDGKTYQVCLILDNRINNGIPYVQVLMKENTAHFTYWEFHVAKSLDI